MLRKFLFLISVCAAIFAFGSCARKPTQINISGQAFIVTKGGTSIKLGLVHVLAFSPDFFKKQTPLWADALAREMDQSEALKKAKYSPGSMTEEDWKEADPYLYSAWTLVNRMTGAEQTVTTDADGKFSISVNPGDVLVANFEREVSDDKERFAWVVQPKPGEQVTFSNENILETSEAIIAAASEISIPATR